MDKTTILGILRHLHTDDDKLRDLVLDELEIALNYDEKEIQRYKDLTEWQLMEIARIKRKD